MNEKALTNTTDEMYDNIVIAGMFTVMLSFILIHYMQSLVRTRVEVSEVEYPAVAGNAGLVWIQVTPAGEPSQVRIIAENSTGAFEEVLLGLTT